MKHTILIRCDSYSGSGMGHLKRCSVLADELKKLGFSVVFALDENSSPMPIDLNFPVHRLSGPFNDILDAKVIQTLAKSLGSKIILGDSYRISREWVAILRSSGFIVILIDEIGIGDETMLRIDYSLIPKKTKGSSISLLGPAYFITDSPRLRSHSSPPRRIIAHAGGTGNFFAAAKVSD